MATTDTEHLLGRAAGGDGPAREQLLRRHRRRLRRMVAARFDPRLAARADPSDVVQEALAEAAAGLDRYLRERPLPFYPWLRQLAQRRLIDLHRRHVQARRRSVTREGRRPPGCRTGRPWRWRSGCSAGIPAPARGCAGRSGASVCGPP